MLCNFIVITRYKHYVIAYWLSSVFVLSVIHQISAKGACTHFIVGEPTWWHRNFCVIVISVCQLMQCCIGLSAV